MTYRVRTLTLFLLILCLSVFVGCTNRKGGDGVVAPNTPPSETDNGSGGDGNDNGSTGGEDDVPLGKLAKEIKQLEAEGKYPVLDRSDTLLGKDENNNGVRDDIEKFINSLSGYTKKQKAVFMQEAYVYNYALSPEFDAKNEEHITKYMDMHWKALMCDTETFGYGGDSSSFERRKVARLIRAFTFNTKKRFLVSLESDRTAGGMTFSSSGEIEGSCDEKFFKD